MSGDFAGKEVAAVTVKEIAGTLLDHVKEEINTIEDREVREMIREILNAERVYVFGAGRSGLVGKAFAMRLMHLGFDVYVVGETITPAMKKEDVLIAISGSGKTASVVSAARAAKEKVGARVVAITSHPGSPLGEVADIIVRVGGRLRERNGEREFLTDQLTGRHTVPIAPLGTLFEVTTMVFLDGVVVELMRLLGKEEEELRKRHANIE